MRGYRDRRSISTTLFPSITFLTGLSLILTLSRRSFCRVVLIDDSIVRGTTSKRIVKLLRDAGAKEIHMRISAPPFLYPCLKPIQTVSFQNGPYADLPEF